MGILGLNCNIVGQGGATIEVGCVRRERECEGLNARGLTPCARIGIIDGRVNVTVVHEIIDLRINET